MPYDEKGRFWTEKRGEVFMSKTVWYRPPPDGEPPEPPPPMGASQEAIDAFDRKLNAIK